MGVTDVRNGSEQNVSWNRSSARVGSNGVRPPSYFLESQNTARCEMGAGIGVHIMVLYIQHENLVGLPWVEK